MKIVYIVLLTNQNFMELHTYFQIMFNNICQS